MNLMVVKDMEIQIHLGGVITSVIGPSNAGKTTLLKKLCNRISNKDIYIDDISISDYDVPFLKKNIAVVFDDNYFRCDSVSEEFFFYLNQLDYSVKEIASRIDEITTLFGIESLLEKRIDNLKVEDRVLVKILSYLLLKPKIFAIDNLMEYLRVSDIKQIIKYIKNNVINLINVVSNAEFLLLGNNVVVMNNYKAVMCGSVASVLEGNSILPYMGVKLPFIVDLSNNLILYGVVEKVYMDEQEMVDEIWK